MNFKIVALTILCSVIFSFCSFEKENLKGKQTTKSEKKIEKSLSAYLENTRWFENREASSMGIFFEKEKMDFGFSISCLYSFPIQFEQDKIIWYWSDEMDCTIETNLDADFGLEKKPILGKPFAELKLISDSTITVNYFYKEWVNSYNSKEWQKFNDTLFLISPKDF